MNVSGSRVARAALVVVGIAFCVLGPTRPGAAQLGDSGGDRRVAVTETQAAGTDHAVAERPSVSLVRGWVDQLSVGVVVMVAASLLAWTVAVTDGPRAVVMLVGACWQRRGPPALLV